MASIMFTFAALAVNTGAMMGLNRLWMIIVFVFVMIVNIAIVGPPSLQIRLELGLGITFL